MDVIVKVRDPDENLEEKIKAYKVKKRIKTTVTILAFAFALISSYLLVKLQTYTSLRTLQSYKNKQSAVEMIFMLWMKKARREKSIRIIRSRR